MKGKKEWLSGFRALLEKNKQFRWLLLLFLCGVLLYLAANCLQAEPQHAEERAASEIAAEQSLQESLEDLLASVSGVGRVQVLLTVEQEARSVYQTDESKSDASSQSETVVVSGAGLVQTVLSPVYRGAVVVCEGADRASVVLAVKAAVRSVTGLSSEQITVIKMKS